LAALQVEFIYTFGGCTTIRGLKGSYLSQTGATIRESINVVYADTPFEFSKSRKLITQYVDELRHAALLASGEEAILVTVIAIYHFE